METPSFNNKITFVLFHCNNPLFYVPIRKCCALNSFEFSSFDRMINYDGREEDVQQ